MAFICYQLNILVNVPWQIATLFESTVMVVYFRTRFYSLKKIVREDTCYFLHRITSDGISLLFLCCVRFVKVSAKSKIIAKIVQNILRKRCVLAEWPNSPAWSFYVSSAYQYGWKPPFTCRPNSLKNDFTISLSNITRATEMVKIQRNTRNGLVYSR